MEKRFWGLRAHGNGLWEGLSRGDVREQEVPGENCLKA